MTPDARRQTPDYKLDLRNAGKQRGQAAQQACPVLPQRHGFRALLDAMPGEPLDAKIHDRRQVRQELEK